MSDPFYSSARRPYEQADTASYRCDHCGKEYTALHFLKNHERSTCTSSKGSLSDLLQESRVHWKNRARKRRRYETDLDVISESTVGDRPMELQPSQPEPSAMGGILDQRHNTIENSHSDLDVPVAQRKAKHVHRIPLRYTHDMLPTPPARVIRRREPAPPANESNGHGEAGATALPPTPPAASVIDTEPAVSGSEGAGATIPSASNEDSRLVVFDSAQNVFGVSRKYLLPMNVVPSHDPDQLPIPEARTSEDHDSPPCPPPASLGPFPSQTTFLLAEWYWQSTKKSLLDFQNLVSIFKDPQFSLEDATTVNWKAIFRSLGANKSDLSDGLGSWITDDGWRTETVSIDIPFHNRMKEPGIKSYTVGNFRYRSIVAVIKEKISAPEDIRSFHYYPYEASWKPRNDSPEVKLYGELYASRSFREAHEKLQRQPRTRRDEGLERIVVGLMFWSDGTQLTAFGGASIWPCYLFFGNDSKYRRGEPSNNLGKQIAYFMKLPDRLNDFFKEKNKGRLPPTALFRYCVRQLFHKQWSILLDAELLDAMKYGIMLMCPDGKLRCFFPRILTYSCDYPEKTLVCGIRNNGTHPCHRCLATKGELFNLGGPDDTERTIKQRRSSDMQAKVSYAQSVIHDGYALSNKNLKGALDPESLVAIPTAFAMRVAEPAFDILLTLAVDILHEFEIGVWKKLFTHLIRILGTLGNGDQTAISSTAELDSRYRCIPPFGRDTIRKFPLNVSEMKRKAARDYEDLLQCAIPSFESLLPEPHNTSLMELLFICAQWHALAKLRLQNDYTLALLDFTTVHLGAKMRSFHRDTCSKIPAKETQKEADARAKKATGGGKGKGSGTAARRSVSLDVFTIKFYFLGDYTSTIRNIGTTDSYSTQTGELYHRMPKSWYPQTDRKDYETQLSQIERRQARLSLLRAGLNHEPQEAKSEADGPLRERATLQAESEAWETVLDCRYIMGSNCNRPIGLIDVLDRAGWGVQDPYTVGFTQKLKQFLLPRILRKLGVMAGKVPLDQWPHVSLRTNRIYSHQILKMNYTTDDVRRRQDVLHVGTPQCNIMCLNSRYTPESRSVEHPYLYGKILGVFHTDVCYVGQLPGALKGQPTFHRIDLVWVNWYQFLGAKTKFSIDRVTLCPANEDASLSFVDPNDIIRAVHLIPQFSLGEVTGPAPKSRLVQASNREIWKAYFVNRFVDRDMFMRYQYGMSVGHVYMRLEAFPPAQVPTIPHDFDHCQLTKEPEAITENGEGTPQSVPVQEVDSEAQATEISARGDAEGVDGHQPGDKDVIQPEGEQQSEEKKTGAEGEGEEDVEEGSGEEDEEEGEEEEDEDEDEDEIDYHDQLDDEELLQYEEMYGVG